MTGSGKGVEVAEGGKKEEGRGKREDGRWKAKGGNETNIQDLEVAGTE